ncbi:hypothetical protein PENSPDRAFT_17781 [Peniophora sp. CONT]|nr:hypothetical protein PENSPDRAFT_17781 [Peniophora sp. CONT]
MRTGPLYAPATHRANTPASSFRKTTSEPLDNDIPPFVASVTLALSSGARSPPDSVSITSSSLHQNTVCESIAKDVLLFALDALAQSADACAPLKSITGGLMFFANWVDVSIHKSLYWLHIE